MNIKRKINRLRRLGLVLWVRGRLQKILYERASSVPRLPTLVMVELTNRCNARCIMCDHKNMTRKKGNMDFDLFKRIIDDADRLGIRQIQLNRLGESLLHPSYIEMIEYATKKERIENIYMVSNGSLLNEENSVKILKSGLDSITFSLEGNSKETYEKIRVGLNYDTVVSNIERFVELRSQLNLSKPYVVMNSILMEDTQEEMEGVRQKWGPLVDELNIISAVHYGGIEDFSVVKVENADAEKQACPQLLTRLAILWNGDATVCCGDIDAELTVGSIKDSTIDELWRGEEIKRIRKFHFCKDFSSLPICDKCDGTNKTKLQELKKAESLYR